MVHTMHVLPSDDQARLWAEYPASSVTAITRAQWSAFPHLQPAAIIPHGVDPDAFTFRSTPSNSTDRYLLYLGRFTPDKGIPHAITTARAVGLPLVLAGPENPFFQAEIKPLVDGQRVRYIGSVTGAQRDAILGGAEALLFPIQRSEAFGLVMIEAMMCGTPVVATALGAVGEIVDDGVTGYLASSVDQLAIKVELAAKLDRRRIRQVAVERFSASRMAREYAQVYETILRSRSAR
jgi:glycosyltransferase involved in cell wall biosynthesis